MRDQLYNIDLSYANYGIVVDRDIVIEAPPIAKWMVGKNISVISTWVIKKRGIMLSVI